MIGGNKIKLFGILGLLASIMVGVGEFLIHFNPIIQSSELPYSFFLGIAQDRFTIGHFLMIGFIPLYILGYWHIYLSLRSGRKIFAQAVLILGIFAFMIGGIWVGSRAFLGSIIQILNEANQPDLRLEIIYYYDLYMENLVQILRVLILLISIFFVITIAKGGTLYPKWMMFFNPILLLLIVFALFFFVRPIGQYLIPTAMNIAHFVLFSASLFALRNKSI